MMKNDKTILKAVSIAILLMSTAANAASKSSQSKGGIFFGVEGDYESVLNSHYIWDTSTDQLSQISVDTTSKNTYTTSYATFGTRFYMGKYIGFGIKGWVGRSQYNNTSVYDAYNDGHTYGDFITKADALIYGAEGQVYLDLFNFGQNIRNTIGLTAGAGYEMSQFSNISVSTVYKPDNIENNDIGANYTDGTIVIDAALHYTINERNRFEVGYKIKQYSKTVNVKVSQTGWANNTANKDRVIGFNLKNAIYASYSFMF